ncbi:MAG: response regulator [Oscillospiraceae bacterium]|nr:response regulator [Oscillospiraceae bacterium]
MPLRECVYRVLLVSASEKFNQSLRELLPESLFSPVVTVGSEGAARRMLLERRFDLLLINAPLPDAFGMRLAHAFAESDMGILLFVKGEQYDGVSLEMMRNGVLTLAKPASPHAVMQALRLLCASRERLHRLEQRTETLERKMEEVRLVSRAKWVLIARYAMTEEEAHRYIEKQAMDRCITKRELAEEILEGT